MHTYTNLSNAIFNNSKFYNSSYPKSQCTYYLCFHTTTDVQSLWIFMRIHIFCTAMGLQLIEWLTLFGVNEEWNRLDLELENWLGIC